MNSKTIKRSVWKNNIQKHNKFYLYKILNKIRQSLPNKIQKSLIQHILLINNRLILICNFFQNNQILTQTYLKTLAFKLNSITLIKFWKIQEDSILQDNLWEVWINYSHLRRMKKKKNSLNYIVKMVNSIKWLNLTCILVKQL